MANTIIPAYDSGLALDAKEASEKAMNLRSSGAIGFILIVTSWTQSVLSAGACPLLSRLHLLGHGALVLVKLD